MSKIIDILLHEHEEISKFIEKLRSMCLDFMKEDKNIEQIVDIPDVDRISALEQAIMEIGEVLGNG